MVQLDPYWWWVIGVLATIWITGWLISVIFGVFFNPLDSEEDRRKDLRGRLLAQGVLNWIMWPFLLPALLQRRKLLKDVHSGKRPYWILSAQGEETSQSWSLADGTEFHASVWSIASSEPAEISADYHDETLTGLIECRARQIAPTEHPPTEWVPMVFSSEPEPHLPDDDASADEEDDWILRYKLSLSLPRGKHRLEFRVRDRAGKIEELSALTLIVADPEDYNL